MDNQKSESGRFLRWGVLAGAYVLAGVVGHWMGTRGLLRFGDASANTDTSTPLARVGFALREDALEATPAGWSIISNDTEIVRRAWKPEDRSVFDLVVALRGLQNSGNAEWLKAEELCRSLNWPRCDRGALEELRKRSRP